VRVVDLMHRPPEPHPLDYDWRFDQQTVERLAAVLVGHRRVVSIGAPSVARRLEALGQDVVLIDRQPHRWVQRQISAEPGPEGVAIDGARLAIVDPPWYPEDVLRWAAYAGQLVGVGNRLLVSIWPVATRPGEHDEFKSVLESLSNWATVSEAPTHLHYEKPTFECKATKAAHNAPLSSSPRKGRLLDLSVRVLPQIPPWTRRRQRWVRFVLNEYQLALRLDATSSINEQLVPHPNARGWIWPYVSNRAPGRSEIDLWSSHNEVAIVGNPHRLATSLRSAFAVHNEKAFGAKLDNVPELLEWDIPRPPYRRYYEWRHLQ
jgi:hypothetical protein